MLMWQQPSAAGLLDIGHQEFVPQSYIEAVGNASFFEQLVGTGPYRLESESW